MKGRNSLIREGENQQFSGKSRFSAKPGDKVRLETPGGGGWERKNNRIHLFREKLDAVRLK